MATHRLVPPTLLSTFLRLPRLDMVTVTCRFLGMVVLLPILLMAQSHSWLLAASWVVAASVDLYALMLGYRRLRADLDAVEHGKRQVMDSMTEQPGGAPIVMDAVAHCGCTHRWAWDSVADEWRQVTVVGVNPDCPTVKAYAY